MCDPTSVMAAAAVAGAVASAGGAYMQYDGQQAASSERAAAQNRATAAARAEADRQQGLTERRRTEAAAIAGEAAPQNMQARMDEAVAERTAQPVLPTDGTDPNRDLLGGQAGASATVRNVISDRMAETRAKMASEALARARLSSWGDAFADLGLDQQPMRERLDMFGDFSRGSSGTLGAEVSGYGAFDPSVGAAARAAGSGLSGAGNAVMSNAGTIGDYFRSPTASAPTTAPANVGSNGRLAGGV